MTVSHLEAIAAQLIKDAGLPIPIREYRLTKDRRWRGDFVWVEPRLVLLEVEGGVFSNGRHTRGKGFTQDCEKYNYAAIEGYIVLRVTDAHLVSGEAILWVRQALFGK